MRFRPEIIGKQIINIKVFGQKISSQKSVAKKLLTTK